LSFLLFHDSKEKPGLLEKNNRIPTREDLQEVLKVCDVLEKAIFLTGASSGLSAVDLCNLLIKDFKYDDDFIATLELTRIKSGIRFCTYLSPECTYAILDYLDFRNREGKTKRCIQHEKQKVLSKDDPLFIKRHVPVSYAITHNDNERALDLEALVKIYRGVSTKARKNTPVGTWNFVRSHTVRKYYNSTMYNAGADSFFIEFMMGHELDDTRAAYFRAAPEELKEIYKRYIPYLTIQKELNISASPEFQAIVKENEILKAEAVKHFVEREELQNLRAEVTELQNRT
jgi:integrase